ncbi:MAG: hypothetical protein M1836_001679 [Candelina mexicana]|nr:MAG: hypothetical protein M1836_001679 [Candelina mexicana]
MATSNTASKPLINLLRGWPSPSLLPTAALASASQATLQNPSLSTPNLLYGDFAGYPPLRAAIAQWLTTFYTPSTSPASESIGPITAERICVTGGASQNIACVLQVYSDPCYTRNIWMVAPTYFLACRIFEDAGFAGKLRAVPEDEEGIDMKFLAEEIQQSESSAVNKKNMKPVYMTTTFTDTLYSHYHLEVTKSYDADVCLQTLKPPRPTSKTYKHIIYAVPTFSNPSSKTMSLLRRQQLVRLAREYDALIVTDDVYDMLQWPTSPSSTASNPSTLDKAVEPRIVDVDRTLEGGTERQGADGFGNAMSNGSFSKIVAPGVRTGWAESTPKFIEGLSLTGSTASGGCPSTLTSTIIYELLQSNDLQHHLHKTLIPTYSSRYHATIAAIETHLLPLGVRLPQSNNGNRTTVVGGYFIWLTLPRGLQAKEVVRRCGEDEELIVSSGSAFEVAGDEGGARFEGFVRICWAWEEEGAIEEGVRRLGRVIGGMVGRER